MGFPDVDIILAFRLKAFNGLPWALPATLVIRGSRMRTSTGSPPLKTGTNTRPR
jgi:hypothetical protein